MKLAEIDGKVEQMRILKSVNIWQSYQMHKLESVQENETQKIPWDVEI